MDYKENLRIQKAEYIKQQLEKQREAEDTLLEQMFAEQKVIDELQRSMDDSMEGTAESRKYNQELQEKMNAQVYAMHGLTIDKMQGMKEYKSAWYKGCAASLFLLSVVLIILCGVLHGFSSRICIFMLAYTAIEGTLLTAGKGHIKVLSVLCGFLYFLMFPTMLVMFVCYELKYPEYDLFLPYTAVSGVILLALGTASYFLYDPYRLEKRSIRKAKGQIKDIEKIAKKEVRKNQKLQEKEEAAREKHLQKEEAARIKQLRKESADQEKHLRKQEAAREKRLRKEEAAQEKRLQKEEAAQRRQLQLESAREERRLLQNQRGERWRNWCIEKKEHMFPNLQRKKGETPVEIVEASAEPIEMKEDAIVERTIEGTEETMEETEKAVEEIEETMEEAEKAVEEVIEVPIAAEEMEKASEMPEIAGEKTAETLEAAVEKAAEA